jgi:hypothetical protein
MLKKICIFTALSASLLFGSANATNGGRSAGFAELGNSSVGNGIFEYDAANGWWWYKEKVKDKDGKDQEIKTKMTNKEKLDYEKDITVIKIMQRQEAALKDIKNRLDYAYPDVTPKYSKNSKGEECLTNSSADCFVLPVQAEAQQVPVMKEWLVNPSPTNSKKYLQWQAKYFNHLSKVSSGLHFSFLNDGPEAYPTDMTFVYNENLGAPMAEDAAGFRKVMILDELKDKIGLMFFFGNNLAYEDNTNAYSNVWVFANDYWANVQKIVIVPNEEAKNRLKAKADSFNSKDVKKFWEQVKIEVRPDLFNSMNIMVTPAVVGVYKTDKGETLYQTLSNGMISESVVVTNFTKFLTYNEIIDPSEMSANKNIGQIQKNLEIDPVKKKETEIFDDTKKIIQGK